MEQVTKKDLKEIMLKLAKLQAEVEVLRKREQILEEKKFTIIDESMAEIWDNNEDEIWNDD